MGRVATAVALALSAGAATLSYAAEPETDPALQEVTVTGSRIVRRDLDAARAGPVS
jgi:hypothetical protein